MSEQSLYAFGLPNQQMAEKVVPRGRPDPGSADAQLGSATKYSGDACEEVIILPKQTWGAEYSRAPATFAA